MKIVIEINDPKLAKKILTIISLFREEGVQIKELNEPIFQKENDGHFKETALGSKGTEFLSFLYKIYDGKENVSNLSDEEALEDALRDKYGL